MLKYVLKIIRWTLSIPAINNSLLNLFMKYIYNLVNVLFVRGAIILQYLKYIIIIGPSICVSGYSRGGVCFAVGGTFSSINVKIF